MIERKFVDGLPPPIARYYCHVTRAGNTVYVSGTTGRDASGKVVAPGDVVEQCRQALANIGKALASVGASYKDVVKVTFYMRNVDDWQKIRPLREEIFAENPPASTMVEIARLIMPEALLEIDAVAVIQ